MDNYRAIKTGFSVHFIFQIKTKMSIILVGVFLLIDKPKTGLCLRRIFYIVFEPFEWWALFKGHCRLGLIASATMDPFNG